MTQIYTLKWYCEKLSHKKNRLPQEADLLTLCVSAGIRTQDPILKRDVLYLLSYLVGLIFEFAKVQLFSVLTKSF